MLRNYFRQELFRTSPCSIVLEDVVVKNKMNALTDSLLRKPWLPIENDDNDNDEFTFKNTMVVYNRKDGSLR